MSEDSLGYSVQEAENTEGDIVLRLVVEGELVARASASSAMLSDMYCLLGLSREAVAQQLRQSLLGVLRSQGQFVEVADIVEDPKQPLRFNGRFTHRLRDEVVTGLVWYDVKSSETGPEDLPAVVRNKMRFTVHRKLTDGGSVARALVDAHKDE